MCKDLNSFFACSIQFSQYQLFNRLSFLHWIALVHHCQKLIDHKCKCLFLDSQSYSIDLQVYLNRNFHPLGYCSFQLALKLESTCFPTMFFLSKIILATLSPLHFHVHFSSCLSITAKNEQNFDRDCVKSVNQFGDNSHLNNIESSKYELSLHLFRYECLSLMLFTFQCTNFVHFC